MHLAGSLIRFSFHWLSFRRSSPQTIADPVEVPRTTSQFRHALHSLIKALYKRLFERLVQRINSSFARNFTDVRVVCRMYSMSGI